MIEPPVRVPNYHLLVCVALCRPGCLDIGFSRNSRNWTIFRGFVAGFNVSMKKACALAMRRRVWNREDICSV